MRLLIRVGLLGLHTAWALSGGFIRLPSPAISSTPTRAPATVVHAYSRSVGLAR